MGNLKKNELVFKHNQIDYMSCGNGIKKNYFYNPGNK